MTYNQPRYSWTQPVCAPCYAVEYGREPSRLKVPEAETCVMCGESTSSGIYIRIDPKTAPHPTNLK